MTTLAKLARVGLLWSAALVAALHGQNARSWVPKDVMRPDLPALVDIAWHSGAAVGDSTRDGLSEYYLVCRIDQPFTGNTEWLQFRDGIAAGGRSWVEAPPFIVSPLGMVFLESPIGYRIVLRDDPQAFPFGRAWTLTPLQVQAPVVPPLPPPYPALYGFLHLLRGGDVNHDGWHDFIAQTHIAYARIAVTCLVDGQTLSVTWQHRAPDMEMEAPSLCSEASAVPDLNGDGIPDYFSSWILLHPSGLSLDYYHVALSGLDGSPIWERRAGQPRPRSYDRHSAYGKDLDGDAVADLVSTGCGEVLALSGTNGSVLWQQDLQALDPFLPFGTADVDFARPTFLTASLGAPGVAEVAILLTVSNTSGVTRYAVAHFDGASGAAIDVAEFPADLLPWSSDLVNSDGSSRFFILGDVDRDGLTEIARPVFSPTTDNPNNSTLDQHLVLFGLQTLFAPDTARIGRSMAVEISLPGAPGLEVILLASDGFDGDGGVVLDGWRTHLADSPLFRQSFGRLPLRGTLDAQGRATLSFTIPNRTALVGRTLWTIGAVRDPNRPGGIWTLSTLGQTLLQI